MANHILNLISTFQLHKNSKSLKLPKYQNLDHNSCNKDDHTITLHTGSTKEGIGVQNDSQYQATTAAGGGGGEINKKGPKRRRRAHKNRRRNMIRFMRLWLFESSLKYLISKAKAGCKTVNPSDHPEVMKNRPTFNKPVEVLEPHFSVPVVYPY